MRSPPEPASDLGRSFFASRLNWHGENQSEPSRSHHPAREIFRKRLDGRREELCSAPLVLQRGEWQKAGAAPHWPRWGQDAV